MNPFDRPINPMQRAILKRDHGYSDAQIDNLGTHENAQEEIKRLQNPPAWSSNPIRAERTREAVSVTYARKKGNQK